MTRAEAAQVMLVIKAAFPSTRFSDENMAVWHVSALEFCDAELGMRVAQDIAREEERFPTPAHFNERVRNYRRREHLEAATTRLQLPSGNVLPLEEQRVRVREIREKLRAIKSQQEAS